MLASATTGSPTVRFLRFLGVLEGLLEPTFLCPGKWFLFLCGILAHSHLLESYNIIITWFYQVKIYDFSSYTTWKIKSNVVINQVKQKLKSLANTSIITLLYFVFSILRSYIRSWLKGKVVYSEVFRRGEYFLSGVLGACPSETTNKRMQYDT